MDISNVTIVGRLTKEAVLKVTNNGTSFVSFTIAWTTGYGEYEKSNFIDCVYFSKSVNNLAPYLLKGQQVCIAGELQQDKWTDKITNEVRSKHTIQVKSLQLLKASQAQQQSSPLSPLPLDEEPEDIAF